MTAPDTGQGPATVAVGYDGSEAAQDAVRWAAEYAAAGNYRIKVVHAWVWPMFTKKLGPVKGVEGSGLRHSAEAILAEGVELARSSLAAARTAGPSTPTAQSVQTDATTSPPAGVTPAGEDPFDAGTDSGVEGIMEAGLPAPVLRDAAGDARLLVVSSRGLGGVLGHVAGSVCLALAGSSPCPLMVVRRRRGPGEAAAPVVVGVDGTSRSSAALAGAARLATMIGAPLQIVHIDKASGRTREGHGRHVRHGQDLLDHFLAEAKSLAPELSITGVLREGHAASKELLAAATDAEVLVIGTHNREGGPGNTVTAVLNKARCNVLITR
ncbi:universal stress protein [Arthrobacter sp. U41]|uniref:universal stress protein n=1 Tax=Arthrobacter sp. U41 TaxID=1849032 RepID=UPI0011A21A67|nr:universal stress protein [Arthrobacter sp. U41]